MVISKTRRTRKKEDFSLPTDELVVSMSFIPSKRQWDLGFPISIGEKETIWNHWPATPAAPMVKFESSFCTRWFHQVIFSILIGEKYVCKTPWKAMAAMAGLTSGILVDHSPSETDSFWPFEKTSEPPHCLTWADGSAQGWGSRSIWHYGSCWQSPSALQWVSLKGCLGERSWLCWDIRRSHEHVKAHRLHVPVSTAHFSIFFMFPRYYILLPGESWNVYYCFVLPGEMFTIKSWIITISHGF